MGLCLVLLWGSGGEASKPEVVSMEGFLKEECQNFILKDEESSWIKKAGVMPRKESISKGKETIFLYLIFTLCSLELFLR